MFDFHQILQSQPFIFFFCIFSLHTGAAASGSGPLQRTDKCFPELHNHASSKRTMPSGLLSAQQSVATALICALYHWDNERSPQCRSSRSGLSLNSTLRSNRPKQGQLWRAVLRVTHLAKRDVQDFPNSWCLHASFIFALRKISIDSSKRHLHHKIKCHTLHISNLDKINMCLEIVTSDRCNTFIVAYCLQVKRWELGDQFLSGAVCLKARCTVVEKDGCAPNGSGASGQRGVHLFWGAFGFGGVREGFSRKTW